MDISAFLNDPSGLALKAVLLLAFLGFAFGVFSALRDGSFQLNAIAAFVRKHLMGRVFPVGTLLVAGYYAHDGMLTAAGLTAAAAYTAETAASVVAAVKPMPLDARVETVEVDVNPVPQD